MRSKAQQDSPQRHCAFEGDEDAPEAVKRNAKPKPIWWAMAGFLAAKNCMADALVAVQAACPPRARVVHPPL
eukprot:CAMPEP_0115299404 /NCGR_PEP_ID=MMETSP0270-20121206/68773_1 /TAXON_ID=71861 /ORGANISM="Scrippsiella trochoidea, Strain CCMP3099" /LENGTH=71 /DNA_ID=CAMNT_0002717145 /DNA_START=184 /DNA_END=395 /DNA_ORIENTATION=+